MVRRVGTSVSSLRWPARIAAAIVGELVYAAGVLVLRTALWIVPAYAAIGVALLSAAREANAPIMHRALGSLTLADVVPSWAQLGALLPAALAIAAIVALVTFLNGSSGSSGALLDDVLRWKRCEDRTRQAAVATPDTYQGG